MFAMPAPASNHNNHLDYDSGTIEKKRPASLVAPESEAARKEKLAETMFSTLFHILIHHYDCCWIFYFLLSCRAAAISYFFSLIHQSIIV